MSSSEMSAGKLSAASYEGKDKGKATELSTPTSATGTAIDGSKLAATIKRLESEGSDCSGISSVAERREVESK